jgi:hypothetical protein
LGEATAEGEEEQMIEHVLKWISKGKIPAPTISGGEMGVEEAVEEKDRGGGMSQGVHEQLPVLDGAESKEEKNEDVDSIKPSTVPVVRPSSSSVNGAVDEPSPAKRRRVKKGVNVEPTLVKPTVEEKAEEIVTRLNATADQLRLTSLSGSGARSLAGFIRCLFDGKADRFGIFQLRLQAGLLHRPIEEAALPSCALPPSSAHHGVNLSRGVSSQHRVQPVSGG